MNSSTNPWICVHCPHISLKTKQHYEHHMSRFHVSSVRDTINKRKKTLSVTPFADFDSDEDSDEPSVFLNMAAISSGRASCKNTSEHIDSPDQVDSQITLADKVYSYCSNFQDKVEPVEKYEAKLSPVYNELLPIEREHIKYCLEEHFSFAKNERVFKLMKVRTEGMENNNFDTSSAFASYLQQRRQEIVPEQNWNTAVIKVAGKNNRSGAVRDILDVLQEVLEETGPDAIVPPEKMVLLGARQYSHPMNTNAALELAETEGFGMPKMFFSIYCDGTTVTRSGSQTKNIVRVRFDNIRGQREKWHEIGICPTFKPKDVKNRTTLAKFRAELFQRFLFLVLKSSIEGCKNGFEVGGALVSPQLLMIVADQRQERALLGPKKVGSFRDCSLCTVESNSIDGISNTTQAEGTLERREYKRDVQKSLQACIAGSINITEVTARLRGVTGKDLRSEKGRAHKYMKEMSVNAYRPALAAVPGFGSYPFHLYQSISFDILHVMDLGVLRIIPDNMHEVFAREEYSMAGNKSALIRIVNQRLVDFPVGAQRRAVSS